MESETPKKPKRTAKKESGIKHEDKNVIKAVGRRKTSVARISLLPGDGKITINEKPYDEYVAKRDLLCSLIIKPLKITSLIGSYNIKIKANGGGVASQADAIRLGISRALVMLNPELKSQLSREGCLARDSRMKERKKYGRKRARKRFQFSKR